MFKAFKEIFGAKPVPAVKATVEKKPRKPRKPRIKAEEVKLTPKEQATSEGKPFVSIINVELEPGNIGNGAFELDWNDHFIVELRKAGFQGDTEELLVDRWLNDLCRNIINENFEQWAANYEPEQRRNNVIDLGNGKKSVS